jgi:hypothetical protein
MSLTNRLSCGENDEKANARAVKPDRPGAAALEKTRAKEVRECPAKGALTGVVSRP